MSYILDALRKADSERERGVVPTLHSHSEPAGHAAKGGIDAQGDAMRRRILWGGGALGLLLVAGWLLLLPAEPPPLQMSSPPAQSASSHSPTAPPTAAPLTPTLVAPPPALEAPAQPGHSVASAAPAGSAVLATAVVAAPVPVPVPALVLKFSELPEATRKALPTITTSGAMYSETPANRMLIVNGQLLHEGDKIAPELLLERIELKSAVLVFRGQRFRISY